MSVVGDANIDNQIATAGRVRQVVDDLEISALQARARGNPLCLNLRLAFIVSEAHMEYHFR